MDRAEQKRRAYYAGKNSIWNHGAKAKVECPYEDAELKAEWLVGIRDARAEVRLDEDTEWDDDAA